MKRSFKIIAVCIAAILSGINMSYAQDGHRFLYGKPGYAGNISFAIGKDFIQGATVDLLTSHGYSFGNGLYLGMGTGLSVIIDGDGVFPAYEIQFLGQESKPLCSIKGRCQHGYWIRLSSYLSVSCPVSRYRHRAILDKCQLCI